MKDFILQCYKEYVKFMDLEPNFLPQIEPIKITIENITNGSRPYAYINSDETGDNPRKLYYSSKLSQYHKDFIKSIIFHELTHLLDEIELSKTYSDKKYSTIMNTYSEYHASQIELACKVGFRNIHSFHKINLDKTFVPYEDKTRKITADYLQPLADSSLIIERPTNYYHEIPCDEYYRYYKTFEAKVMYYLGKKNFCKKYSLTKIPDITQKTYGEFYPIIHSIEQSIINNDLDSLPTLINQLWNKYLSVFTIKKEELEILLNILN